METNEVLNTVIELVDIGAGATVTRAWTVDTEVRLCDFLAVHQSLRVEQTRAGFTLIADGARMQFSASPDACQNWLSENDAAVTLFSRFGCQSDWVIVPEKATFIDTLMYRWVGDLVIALRDDGFSLRHFENGSVDDFKLVNASPLSWLLANISRDFKIVTCHNKPEEEKPMNEKPGIPRNHAADQSTLPSYRSVVGGDKETLLQLTARLGADTPLEVVKEAVQTWVDRQGTGEGYPRVQIDPSDDAFPFHSTISYVYEVPPELTDGDVPKPETPQEASLLPEGVAMLTCIATTVSKALWLVENWVDHQKDPVITAAKTVVTKGNCGNEVVVMRQQDSYLALPEKFVIGSLCEHTWHSETASFNDLIVEYTDKLVELYAGGVYAHIKVFKESPLLPSFDAVKTFKPIGVVQAITETGDALTDAGMHLLDSLVTAMKNLAEMELGESAAFDLTSLAVLFHGVKKDEGGIHSAAKFRVAGKMFQCTDVDDDGVYVKVVKAD